MSSLVEGFVVVLTVGSTISTGYIYSNSPAIVRRMAVYATLAMATVVLAIEIAFHLTRPRPEELIFAGPEWAVIIMFVLYEYIPTLSELESLRKNSKITCVKNRIEWAFGILGVLIAVLSLGHGVTLYGHWQEMADTINAYGLLFVIPTVGVGELVLLCAIRRSDRDTRESVLYAMVVDIALVAPFMVLFFLYLPFLTAIAYFSTTIAFFADSGFGVRRGYLIFASTASVNPSPQNTPSVSSSSQSTDVELGEINP